MQIIVSSFLIIYGWNVIWPLVSSPPAQSAVLSFHVSVYLIILKHNTKTITTLQNQSSAFNHADAYDNLMNYLRIVMHPELAAVF